MKLIPLLLALLLSPSVLAQDTQKHGIFERESLLIQNGVVGTMVALRVLPMARGTHFLNVTIRLRDFNAVGGAHLAFGLGDIYRYFDTGVLPPVADGFVIGQSNQCPEKGIAVNFESYGGEIPGKTLDCPTAYGPLRIDWVYQVRLSVTATGVTAMTVHLEDGTLVWGKVTRTFDGQHKQHARGLFIVPVSPTDGKNGAYELLRVSAGVYLYDHVN